MTDLEKLRRWLLTYPNWNSSLQVDFMEAGPGNAGLFPAGLEETQRREDVLGNLEIGCRYRFVLHRKTTGQQDGKLNAQWLLDFQNWVRQQSITGTAPHFGDIPTQERMEAKRGALKVTDRTGTGVYEVTLIADFMKVYEVK